MYADRVTAVQHPTQSDLHQRVTEADFLDSYCVASAMSPRRAAQVITAFPGWAKWLLQIRRIVVAPLGLSNDGPDATDKLGAFPIESETDRELVAGFDDKHLDFRVSVMALEGCVYLGTWVHPHNVVGRLYLRVIMPFHILIVRNALRRVASQPTP